MVRGIQEGGSSLEGLVRKNISERESRKFQDKLNTKVKLAPIPFGKTIKFIVWGVAHAGSRLLYKELMG